jgi:hypothetical protein
MKGKLIYLFNNLINKRTWGYAIYM